MVGVAYNLSRKNIMMNEYGMGGGMFVFSVFGLLVLVLVILGIAALIKYLRS